MAELCLNPTKDLWLKHPPAVIKNLHPVNFGRHTRAHLIMTDIAVDRAALKGCIFPAGNVKRAQNLN